MNLNDPCPRLRPNHRVPSWPAAIVDLAATARVFDLISDVAPKSLLGLVSLANGYYLRQRNARQADALMKKVWKNGRPEFISPSSLARVAKTPVDDPSAWNKILQTLLTRENPEMDLPEPEHLMLAGVQVGLALGDFPSAVKSLEVHLTSLAHETRFVATRLAAWSGRKLRRPKMHPFTEYCVAFEPTPEGWLRKALQPVIDQTASVVLHYPQAWHLGSWSWAGWGFGREADQTLRELAMAAGPRSKDGVLQGDAALYATTIKVFTKEPEKPFDVAGAFYLYIENLNEGTHLADYRAGRNPRQLARLAFEFAYRMGLRAPSSHPRTVSLQDRRIWAGGLLDCYGFGGGGKADKSKKGANST